MREVHTRRKRRWMAAGLVTLLLTGCPLAPQLQSAPPLPPQIPTAQIKHAPATPIALKKAELGDEETWDPAWDGIVELALPDDLLWSKKVGNDVRTFCPRYNTMSVTDRRTYWAYFFQALAGAEAGLRATADVRHTEPEVAVRDGVTHRMVRAEGLLQLTYEDARRYGCSFSWTQDRNLPQHDPGKTILQPRNNLLCGVRILHSQLIDKHKPLLTHSSYWSTLRPGWPGYSEFVKQMANVPNACERQPQHLPQSRAPMVEAQSAPSPSTPSSTAIVRSAFASTPGH